MLIHTITHLIDKLTLYAKNTFDNETNTACHFSLHIEYVKLRNTEQEPYTIDFDFLGKDSMRYQNTVQIEPKAWKAIESFCKGKRKSEELFDKISVGALNTYLKKFMPELSAKVFRTYNASITLQQELAKLPEDFDRLSVDQKLLFYNRANRQVAILCNHQRTVKQTTFSAGMGKFKLALKENIDEYHRIKKHLRRLTTSKKYADSSDDMELDFSSDDEEIKQYKIAQEEREEFKKKQAAFEEAAAKRLKEEKWDDESDDRSADSNSDDGKDKKKEKKEVKKEKGVKRAPAALPDDPDKCLKKLRTIKERVRKIRTKMTEKTELKNFALSTSKLNYMDPRITVAFCKRVALPIEKVFSKTIRDKFNWAMDTDEDFEW